MQTFAMYSVCDRLRFAGVSLGVGLPMELPEKNSVRKGCSPPQSVLSSPLWYAIFAKCAHYSRDAGHLAGTFSTEQTEWRREVNANRRYMSLSRKWRVLRGIQGSKTGTASPRLPATGAVTLTSPPFRTVAGLSAHHRFHRSNSKVSKVRLDCVH